jgi:hypothetical protein
MKKTHGSRASTNGYGTRGHAAAPAPQPPTAPTPQPPTAPTPTPADLDDLIAAAMRAPATAPPVGCVARVRAATARRLLEAQPVNRPVNQDYVDQFARAMRAGNWQVIGQGLGLGRAGELYDGQHRLWAVLESGLPHVDMFVVVGLGPEARAATDSGRARRPSDQLAMFDGVSSARAVFAWAGAISRLVYGVTPKLSYEDARAWYAANREDIAGLVDARGEIPAAHRKSIDRAPVMGALLFARRRHPAEIDAFARRLARGGLETGDPCHTLREWLLGDRSNSLVTNDSARAGSLKVLRAAQLALAGRRDIGRLQPGEEGVRYFLQAHTPATLPPMPRGLAAGATAADGAPTLQQRAAALPNVRAIARMLVASGMDAPEAMGWALQHYRAVPVLAKMQIGEIGRQVLERATTAVADRANGCLEPFGATSGLGLAD